MSANQEIIAELRRVLNERDDAREQLYVTKAELGRWVDRETKAARERDEARREADRLRHGCTVESGFVCPNELAVSELTAERNFLRALKKNHEEDFARVCKERDEARAEVHRLREMAHDFEAMREDRDSAYRRGAEAMRARCEETARHACSVIGKLEHTYGIMTQGHIETVSRLILEADIPEEP